MTRGFMQRGAKPYTQRDVADFLKVIGKFALAEGMQIKTKAAMSRVGGRARREDVYSVLDERAAAAEPDTVTGDLAIWVRKTNTCPFCHVPVPITEIYCGNCGKVKEGAAWVYATCHLAQTDVTYHGSAAVTCAYAHKGCEGLRAQGRDLMKVDMDKMAKIFAALKCCLLARAKRRSSLSEW